MDSPRKSFVRRLPRLQVALKVGAMVVMVSERIKTGQLLTISMNRTSKSSPSSYKIAAASKSGKPTSKEETPEQVF